MNTAQVRPGPLTFARCVYTFSSPGPGPQYVGPGPGRPAKLCRGPARGLRGRALVCALFICRGRAECMDGVRTLCICSIRSTSSRFCSVMERMAVSVLSSFKNKRPVVVIGNVATSSNSTYMFGNRLLRSPSDTLYAG